MISKKQFFTTAKDLKVYDLLISGHNYSILIAFSQIAEALTNTIVWTEVIIDGNNYIKARYLIPNIKQEVIVWSASQSIADHIYMNNEEELLDFIKAVNEINKNKSKLLKLLK